MYEVIIYTNIKERPEIHIKVKDLQDPEYVEKINQPYVIGSEAHKIKELTLQK